MEGRKFKVENENMLTPKEVSERLGVSLRTLYTWEKEGSLVPYKSPGIEGRKFYSEEQIEEFWKNIEKERLERIARAKKIAADKKAEKERLKLEKNQNK